LELIPEVSQHLILLGLQIKCTSSSSHSFSAATCLTGSKDIGGVFGKSLAANQHLPSPLYVHHRLYVTTFSKSIDFAERTANSPRAWAKSHSALRNCHSTGEASVIFPLNLWFSNSWPRTAGRDPFTSQLIMPKCALRSKYCDLIGMCTKAEGHCSRDVKGCVDIRFNWDVCVPPENTYPGGYCGMLVW
jgi:hypothetical protein